MDPYLERPRLWTQVHTALIIALQEYLTPLLRPRYVVDVEQRIYQEVMLTHRKPDELVGEPDVFVTTGEREATWHAPVATLCAQALPCR